MALVTITMGDGSQAEVEALEILYGVRESSEILHEAFDETLREEERSPKEAKLITVLRTLNTNIDKLAAILQAREPTN